MSDTKTLLVRIEGRVQGVWYRGWTTEEAQKRNLSGWVRNRHDGTVEALFHGPSAQVEDMVRACHKGPSAAKVLAVKTDPVDQPPPDGFTQRPTA